MPRHANQRALTVNTKRVNTNPQVRKVENKVATKCTRDDDFMDLHEDYDAPMYAGANLQLLLTGQYRAGAGH